MDKHSYVIPRVTAYLTKPKEIRWTKQATLARTDTSEYVVPLKI